MNNPTSSSDALSGPEKITSKGQPSEAKIKPDSSAFRSHMNETPPESKEISPIDLSKTGIEQTTPSTSSLLSQLQATQASMGDIKDQLNTSKLKFKHSQHLANFCKGDKLFYSHLSIFEDIPDRTNVYSRSNKHLCHLYKFQNIHHRMDFYPVLLQGVQKIFLVLVKLP